MQRTEITNDIYLQKVNKVTEYIGNNLDSPLDVKTLAEISNLSMYHFHKIMSAFLKEPLYSYITRIRLEAAAYLLRYSQLPVQEIADAIGYDAPSSLSKAFRKAFGISPSEYRRDREFMIQRGVARGENVKIKPPKLREINDRNIIYVRLQGAYWTVDYEAAYQRLWDYVKANKLFTAGVESLAIGHDDPRVTDGDRCRTDVCLAIHKPAIPKGDIGTKVLNGGLFAIFTYQGPYSNLGEVYDTIFAKWLPESGYELRDESIIAKYLPNITEPEKFKTEIQVPLRRLGIGK